MVKRIITAAIAIPIGVLILVLDNPHLITAVVTFFSVAAVYEILNVTKYIQHKFCLTICYFKYKAYKLQFCENAAKM